MAIYGQDRHLRCFEAESAVAIFRANNSDNVFIALCAALILPSCPTHDMENDGY